MLIKELLDSWMGKSAKIIEILGATYVHNGGLDSVPEELKELDADDYEFKPEDGYGPSRLVIHSFLENGSPIKLVDFLNLCQNKALIVVVSISGSGRIYEGPVAELKNEHSHAKMLSANVEDFLVTNGNLGPELYIKIGGST